MGRKDIITGYVCPYCGGKLWQWGKKSNHEFCCFDCNSYSHDDMAVKMMIPEETVYMVQLAGEMDKKIFIRTKCDESQNEVTMGLIHLIKDALGDDVIITMKEVRLG